MQAADFDVILIPFMTEILMDESTSDTVKDLRLNALGQLRAYLSRYARLGYIPELLFAIAEKKGKLITEISSKTEMEKMLKPHCPRYNGANFVPDNYCIPEEELICWSETSLRGPLNDVGFKRYMELFKSVFPEYAEIFKQ